MSKKYESFRDEILSFQYKVKDASGIFIYYKELFEILSTLNSKDKPLTEDSICLILTQKYLDKTKKEALDKLINTVVDSYNKRNNRLTKDSNQIVITKDILKKILEKEFKMSFEKIVISNDFEKIFLKKV